VIANSVSLRESPLFIDAGQEMLFGMLTQPTEVGNGIGVILLTGGDDIPSTNRNRVSVRLARRLASVGYHVLRLDYRGVGESTGGDNGYSLDNLAVEDLDAAIRWLEQRGISELVLAGSCFGARTCLARASTTLGLRALILISSPVVSTNPLHASNMPLGLFVQRMRRRKPLRGLLRFDKPAVRAESKRILYIAAGLFWSEVRSWIRPLKAPAWTNVEFVDSVAALPGRQVPLLLIYGDSEPDYGEFMHVMGDQIDRLDENEQQWIKLSVLPGEVHAFAEVDLQRAVEDEVVSFLFELHDRSLAARG
jgi:pimeloyl-ACP methyl ester carboxylesterase